MSIRPQNKLKDLEDEESSFEEDFSESSSDEEEK